MVAVWQAQGYNLTVLSAQTQVETMCFECVLLDHIV